LLKEYIGEGNVLYPLQHIGFKLLTLSSWDELPDTLLSLDEAIRKNPKQYESWSQHNSKLWAQVKSRLSKHIVQAICKFQHESMKLNSASDFDDKSAERPVQPAVYQDTSQTPARRIM
jgi:hypothetical protein